MSHLIQRQEYKDFGACWLGKIPVDWRAERLKYVANVSSEKIGATRGRRYVGMENISSGDGKYVTAGDVVPDGLSVAFRRGDVLFGKLRPYLAKSWLAAFSGICSSEFLVLRTERLAPKFLNYVTLSREFVDVVDSSTYGAKMPRASWDFIGMLKVPLPSQELSSKIARFLDYETAKIDRLIEKQQQLIALLEEKRQAVISHAVTKGLNPDAPMKDSGIEWLGQVPAHWEVKRLKHISPRVGVGLVINPSTYTRDEGVYFIFGGDVKEHRFDLSGARRIAKADSDRLRPSRLSSGDLVSVRVGEPGVTAVVPPELEGGNCASVVIIRRGDFDSDWLCSAMNSWVGRRQVGLVSYGAAQKQFNISDAVEFRFPTPPLSEQTEIAAYIAQKLSRFDDLTANAESAVSLLQERRTALISAAVTGKIDVRSWKPAEEVAEAQEVA